MIIQLTPEIERSLTKAARERGVSPEQLALSSLSEQFDHDTADAPAPLPEDTLAHFLDGYVGVLHSSEHVEGGAHLSDDVDQKFTAVILERHRQQQQ